MSFLSYLSDAPQALPHAAVGVSAFLFHPSKFESAIYVPPCFAEQNAILQSKIYQNVRLQQPYS